VRLPFQREQAAQNTTRMTLSRITQQVILTSLLGSLSAVAEVLATVPIVPPGAPGQSPLDLDAETAVAITNSAWIAADVICGKDYQ